jgi:hypothetical protein
MRVTRRDPRTDPQPGDEVRVDNLIRRVVERDGERVFVHALRTHYWMRMDRWQEWSKHSDAMVAKRIGRVNRRPIVKPLARG